MTDKVTDRFWYSSIPLMLSTLLNFSSCEDVMYHSRTAHWTTCQESETKNSNCWTGSDLRKSPAPITQFRSAIVISQLDTDKTPIATQSVPPLHNYAPLHNCAAQLCSLAQLRCSMLFSSNLLPIRNQTVAGWTEVDRGGQRGRKHYFWRRRDPCGALWSLVEPYTVN